MIGYLDLVTRLSAEDKRRSFSAQRIGDGMRVLDVGCGTGDDVRAIAELVGPNGYCAGIDTSRMLVDEARNRGTPENAAFHVAAAAALPFADGTFDAVRAERVFQHLEDPHAAAREIHRVLAPGGTAFVLDQDWETLCIAGADRDVTRAVARAFAQRLANGCAGRDARAVLRRSGFTSVEVAPAVAMPSLPVAFELIFQPALDAALADGTVDASTAHEWLSALLQADVAGEFFCCVTVVAALGRR